MLQFLLLTVTITFSSVVFAFGGAQSDQNQGALVIAGGAKLPHSVVDRFIELAGGPSAKIVVIPTASENTTNHRAQAMLSERLKRLNPNHQPVIVRHANSTEEINSPGFLKPLRQATGVWITGGDQSRLTATYLGTSLEKELYNLVKRGGVVGGTSAGAAVQSKMMIAGGNPIPKITRGFDLLPQAIVDQHFLARRRFFRLQNAVERFPHRIGIGVDEGTALVVKGSQAQVVGESSVTVIFATDSGQPATEYFENDTFEIAL